MPSTCLWLVSPWITDVDILNNTAGTFPDLNRFGRRHIRLAEILVTLAAAGSTVVIGTTSDSHNSTFLHRVRSLARDLGVTDRVSIVVDVSGRLHSKALTGDGFAVSGSMNITYNGINVREEQVELRIDEEYVSRARMDAYDRFGGSINGLR
ncbi:Aspartokinase [Actinokineospora spheciospongiae]|uniref:Aspartokinase n=2 Tax=Actinokineospora spheciospongiae TaxID=909613 RepID=W7IUS8_9PSEU|nr:Aspartokinase [Actinokineospora spheciospongiae]